MADSNSSKQSACEILKAIRKEIADLNGIPYVPPTCPHSGECQLASCPVCEQEMAQIEAELRSREARGEPVKREVSAALKAALYDYVKARAAEEEKDDGEKGCDSRIPINLPISGIIAPNPLTELKDILIPWWWKWLTKK